MPREIAIWRPELETFFFCEEKGPQDSRHHVEHDDYGDGGFTGIRYMVHTRGPYEGRPVIFRLKDHLDRLESSVAAVGSVENLPCERQSLERWTHELASRNVGDTYIRHSVAGGGEIKVSAPGEPPRMYIATRDMHPIHSPYLTAKQTKDGLNLMITPKRRGYPDEETLAKVRPNYLRSINATKLAKKCGFDEGVLIDHTGEFVSEISVMNLIAFFPGRVLTPDWTSGALKGLTMQTVGQLLLDRFNTRLEQVPIPIHSLFSAVAIIGTGTACGAVRIGRMEWPEEGLVWTHDSRAQHRINRMVKDLTTTYWPLLEGSHTEKYPDWFTPVEQLTTSSVNGTSTR